MTRQVVASAYGEPRDVVTIREVPAPQPGPGEVLITVEAAGMNPADLSALRGLFGADPSKLPLPLGMEVAGTIAAIGPESRLAAGRGAVGDAVVAWPVRAGYADHVVVAAGDVFPKPEPLSFAQGANLLLAGTTAADMQRVVPVGQGDTVLIHGASGAVGVSLMQQLLTTGARVIGTASPRNFELLRSYGTEPVAHGEGLAQRLRGIAPRGITAAYDTAGTDEAVDVSLGLLADRARLVSIAAFARAQQDGFTFLAGGEESRTYRNAVRLLLLQLASQGRLTVPVARTYPLTEARAALEFLAGRHPGGKLALIP